MKPSNAKKKSKKKKRPSPPAAEGPPPTPPAAAGSRPGAPCSPLSETLTLAAAAAAAAAVSEAESGSSSGGDVSAYTRAFSPSSSGTASTSSFYAPSSSDSTASSSATGDERRDLAWLLEAFGSATIDQVDSAYREAGGDPFLAAGILGSTQDQQPPPQPPAPPDLSPRAGSAGRRAARRPRKLPVAASGMVADVIGKGYSRPATPPVSVPSGRKDRDGGTVSNGWNDERNGKRVSGPGDPTYNVEEAEQFLCSMLGDSSELSMGVVRDVLVSKAVLMVFWAQVLLKSQVRELTFELIICKDIKAPSEIEPRFTFDQSSGCLIRQHTLQPCSLSSNIGILRRSLAIFFLRAYYTWKLHDITFNRLICFSSFGAKDTLDGRLLTDCTVIEMLCS